MRSFIILGAAAIVAVVSTDVTGELLTFTGSASGTGTVLTTGIVTVTQATHTVFDCSPASNLCFRYDSRQQRDRASVESSASAAAPSGESGSEAPAPSTPAGSETSTAPPAGSETATAPPGSLATATGTPTPLSSSRSSVNKGCGFLLGRDVYFNGGEWCLSVVPVHERISGTRNPEKARREQEREERREQESKGPLTEQ
ncbi:hypothetical protein LTR22_004075 [Elasticomyces elasticus]|nr:hypothetical protein LTR22_004075 [Elasticomyces elasticus]KAK4931602.1 hypothetical protein LTR49_001992 [Elasticomyces elasticus]KAK5766761.1 hypothetical protein LTS12_003112 [Elasticomyces elasticus]